MRIAIDSSPLSTGHALRGVGVYTKHLIDALRQYEPGHTYTLFTQQQNVPKNIDLVHYPYFDPYFLTLPLIKEKPTIVTVHDLIPLVFPDKFPAGVRGYFKWRLQKLSLSGAKRIITDSISSKNDVHKITGFEANNIDTIYLAPDPVFTVQKIAGMTKPYILFVGDVNWNKNVQGLLRAFATTKDILLILVGGAFLNTALPETREINRLANALGIEKRVTRAGHVSDKELAQLYSGAQALVQPSFYEGFGLPVLEAMACGCPVVSTKNSSLGEIAGPALSITTDVDSIAAGIRKIRTVERRAQAQKQRIWCKQFTWKRVAAETVASYEKTFNHHTGI